MKTGFLFCYCLLYAIVIGHFFNIGSDYFNIKHETTPNFSSRNEEFLLAVIIAPIIETVIYQLILYKLFEFLNFKQNWHYTIAMSFVFSQFHWYSWIYVLMVFFNSLGLNYFYVKTFKTKGASSAFFLTVMLHSLYNLYGFLFVT